VLTCKVNSGYRDVVTTRPLASLLRELREQQGSSLRAAARELDVDPSYLSRLERGEKPASSQMLQRAATYYDVPLERLELAKGALPDDVVEILLEHPDLIERLRTEYGRP
jgi:transcriptional regulator with XRE-family HTH domain